MLDDPQHVSVPPHEPAESEATRAPLFHKRSTPGVGEAPAQSTPPAEQLKELLKRVSQEDLARLDTDELNNLTALTQTALHESRIRDRKQLFAEMISRLHNTDIARLLNEGTENERKDALRDVKDFLCAIGFRISLEALEKFTRSRVKKAALRNPATGND